MEPISAAWPFPFVPQDWEQTPTVVQTYVHTLHEELTQLRARVEALEVHYSGSIGWFWSRRIRQRSGIISENKAL